MRSICVKLGASLIVFVILLALVEALLAVRVPQRRLPLNGVRDGVLYTWGHPVVNNRHGFRERELATPKPPATYRVMVLGDSLTWGVGLAPAERYTDRSEALLRRWFPQRDIEVLNFGVPGASLLAYRDTLRRLGTLVQPDLIVVGFCFNDPQPAGQDFSRERQRIQDDFSSVLWALGIYGRVAPNTERRAREALWGAFERFGLIPPWPAALDRTYDPQSTEWQNFVVAALDDIRRFADELSLPPPILTILNQGSSSAKPTYYSKPDPLLALILRWYQQVHAAARAAGLLAIDHAAEFQAELDGQVLAINSIDGHPGVEQHRIYAEKLAATIAREYLRVGDSATADSPALTAAPALH